MPEKRHFTLQLTNQWPRGIIRGTVKECFRSDATIHPLYIAPVLDQETVCSVKLSTGYSCYTLVSVSYRPQMYSFWSLQEKGRLLFMKIKDSFNDEMRHVWALVRSLNKYLLV
jgi:hypothetical protein